MIDAPDLRRRAYARIEIPWSDLIAAEGERKAHEDKRAMQRMMLLRRGYTAKQIRRFMRRLPGPPSAWARALRAEYAGIIADFQRMAPMRIPWWQRWWGPWASFARMVWLSRWRARYRLWRQGWRWTSLPHGGREVMFVGEDPAWPSGPNVPHHPLIGVKQRKVMGRIRLTREAMFHSMLLDQKVRQQWLVLRERLGLTDVQITRVFRKKWGFKRLGRFTFHEYP